ncbi:MAG: hypothetical protein ACE5F6_06870 [Anaerolineae bacterium]
MSKEPCRLSVAHPDSFFNRAFTATARGAGAPVVELLGVPAGDVESFVGGRRLLSHPNLC